MNDLLNYFNVYNSGDEKDKERIVSYVSDVLISYPSEIARTLLMDTSRVLVLMNSLLQEKKLKRLVLNPDFLHPKLERRIQYFWNLGMIGFKAFIDKSWVELNDNYDEVLNEQIQEGTQV